MKLIVAGDSAGQGLASQIAAHLKDRPGLSVEDAGAAPKDERYATTTERAVTGILDGRYDRGILVCGTGIGVCISANKVPGIRAALTHDTYSAERAAKSNNAQVITLGARVVGAELAKAIVDKYLESDFDPQSSSGPNVEAIDELDRKYHKG